MLDIVVCEDNRNLAIRIKNVVEKFMFNSELQYDIKVFNDYNKEFYDYINIKRGNIIYILDIVTPTGSGIDAARTIRKKDTESVIIFLTGHEELGMTILKDELYFLTFINKYDNYEIRLRKSLQKALTILGNKQMLKFNDSNCVYTISLSEILYMQREKIVRKTAIVTDNNKILVNKPLKHFKKMLPNKFIYIGRNAIVNKDRIRNVDRPRKVIIFDNSKKTELLVTHIEEDIL